MRSEINFLKSMPISIKKGKTEQAAKLQPLQLFKDRTEVSQAL